MVEEAFLLKQLLELRELRLDAGFLDRLGLRGEAAEFLNLLPHLISAARKRDRFEHRLQPLAFALLHLLQLFRIGEVRGRMAGDILSALEAFFQPAGAILKRTAHGMTCSTQAGADKATSGSRPRARAGPRPRPRRGRSPASRSA